MDKNKYINNKIRKMLIVERNSGSRFSGKITENGIRKSFYGTTKAEVRNKAKEWLSQMFDKNVCEPTVSLSIYMEYWLKTYKLNKVEMSTYERLESIYTHQIKNQIGNVKLCDLTTFMIQSLIDSYASPASPTDKALAVSGLKKLKELIHACLNVAVEEGLIEKNPCNMVVLPNKNCVAVPTKTQLTLSDIQIEDFKNACLSRYKTTGEYKTRDGLVLLIILSLGLRVGEALALLWSDIDFQNKIISIRKTIQFTKKHGTIVKEGTKTMAGSRVLPLNDSVISYFNEMKAYDKRNNIQTELVCCTVSGTQKNARNLQRSMDRILSWTNITEHISLHTLRHTFGSCLIRKGVSIEVVSELMGHASITITYNKYIHVLQEQKAMAMQLTHIV